MESTSLGFTGQLLAEFAILFTKSFEFRFRIELGSVGLLDFGFLCVDFSICRLGISGLLRLGGRRFRRFLVGCEHDA